MVYSVELLDTETFGARLAVSLPVSASGYQSSLTFGAELKITVGNVANFTIHNDGYDYFCWRGNNGTLSDVAAEIADFDESTEYVAVWNSSSWDDDDWCWIKYYGDSSGTDANVNQLDVIKVHLTDSGTQVISMSSTNSISCDRTVLLDYTGTSGNKGYNYTCYCCDLSGGSYNVSDIATAIPLQNGEVLSWWDNATQEWRGWIVGISHDDYDYTINVTRPIFETKVHTDVNWVISC